MKNQSYTATKIERVPKKMVTGPNCIVVPAKNTFTFPSGKKIKCGQRMVFNLDACPKHGDIVLMLPNDRPGFVRECFYGAVEQCKREDWCMGVLDNDDETVVVINIGKIDKVGVMTGILHKQKPIAA